MYPRCWNTYSVCLFKVVFKFITFGKNTKNTLSVIDMVLCQF